MGLVMGVPKDGRHPRASAGRLRDRALREAGAKLKKSTALRADSPVAEHPLRHPIKHGKLYRRLKRAGVRKPGLQLAVSRAHQLPVALVVAMEDQETGIPQRNVFGCDLGPQGGHPPYCEDQVTEKRVKALLASGKSNGVGWTQLTWRPLVLEADGRRGGAAKPRNQVHVGVSLLADDVRAAGSIWGGLERYNGSAAYANEVLARFHEWHKRLS